MLGQYLLAFREVLEAALIISVILAYLSKTENKQLAKHVWIGVAGAVISSIFVAIGVWIFYGGLPEAASKLFEGVAALTAVVVLTSMILWMAIRGRNLDQRIKERVQKALSGSAIAGIIGLSFIVVFREAFETVLFLLPFAVNDLAMTIVGGTLGIVSALAISLIFFKIGKRLDVKRFFYFSSFLMIFLAAGLTGYGIHELLEYQELIGGYPGWLGEYAYKLGIEKGTLFHHKGAIGSIFAVLFGYSVKMEWARLIIHLAYLSLFIPLTVFVYKKPTLKKSEI